MIVQFSVQPVVGLPYVCIGFGYKLSVLSIHTVSGKFSRVKVSRVGHFECFCILIFEDSPGKWSHTHKWAMCLLCACAGLKFGGLIFT